jgi:hypothetical protein
MLAAFQHDLNLFQNYKRSKKATDQCVAQLTRITGPEPVKDELCESVLSTVMESREKTCVTPSAVWNDLNLRKQS